MGISKQNCIVFFIVFAPTITLALGLTIELEVGFYLQSQRCLEAESIVKSTVKKHFDLNPTVAPGLLRMHFHDCFVRGCDASVLLDGPDTEKTALPNLGLRGYEVIYDAKLQLEASCPGVVSCADILALAARDAVALTTGISWSVPTGRLDGTVSRASETIDLPSFSDSVGEQKLKFSAKGLSTQDLVALVGGHSIGTSACQFFSYRLYNYNNTGSPDPSISSTFLPVLRNLCPENGNDSVRVGLDNGSSSTFDASFFTNIKNERGVLESDQKLWGDASTKTFVLKYLPLLGSRNMVFDLDFANSMIKMSKIGIMKGSAVGYEIRTNCSKIN